ncbi:hypothetical protein J3E72DRAFT_266891 [Bipolaris maydis]|nr:hypothetical protein BM1_05706 [Bipolaris maydis]KAJ6199371.1 hypothetical protein J3E72DRAFT_266891 [Bipolaris maydis]
MQLNIAFTFLLTLGSVIASPAPAPQSGINNLAPELVAREKLGIVRDVVIQKQQLHGVQARVMARSVGYAAPNRVAPLEKRDWQLTGRVLRIVATITVAAGQVLNEIYDVIFGGPGDVNPTNNNVITISNTEIDAGDDTFSFNFQGQHDGWIWRGQIDVTEDGGVNFIRQLDEDDTLQQLVGDQYVNRPAGNLQLGCGFV